MHNFIVFHSTFNTYYMNHRLRHLRDIHKASCDEDIAHFQELLWGDNLSYDVSLEALVDATSCTNKAYVLREVPHC